MASFFNSLSNPFSTQVGQKIEEVTDSGQTGENWALILEICDLINGAEDGPRDAIRAIRKRLQQNVGKNHRTVLYTLTLLEACVKNCDRKFHVLACSQDTIQDLMKLMEPKYDPPVVVQDKILSLIQSWADAFYNQPDMSAVVRMYKILKTKGVQFPMTDLDSMAPIHTPHKILSDSGAMKLRSVGGDEFQSSRPDVVDVNTEYTFRLTPEQMAKLRSELDIVQENMTILNEMLTEMVPGQEHPSDLELLTTVRGGKNFVGEMLEGPSIPVSSEVESLPVVPLPDVPLLVSSSPTPTSSKPLKFDLKFKTKLKARGRPKRTQQLHKTCKTMQNRLVELISQLTNDEVTAELLRINDLLNNLFLRYSRYEKNRPVPSQSEETTSLIDLRPDDDNVKTETLLSDFKGLSMQNQVGMKPAEESNSDFDMFAQSRTASYENSKKSGSTYEDNLKSDQLKGGIASVTLSRSQPPSLDPDIIGMHRESDFDEMAAWLQEQGATETDSLTSSEFDRFLAERAAAAEHLTNTSESTRRSSSSSSSSNANKTATSQRTKYANKDMYAL